jgi:ketosteroid isomerase-like protein
VTAVTEIRIPEKADPGPTLEELKQFVRNHFEDFVNRKKSGVAFANFSSGFPDDAEPIWSGSRSGGGQENDGSRLPALAGLHVTAEDILAEGDKVMVRNTWTGAEAATGQKIEFHGSVLWRFRNHKIVERWAAITPPKPAGAV